MAPTTFSLKPAIGARFEILAKDAGYSTDDYIAMILEDDLIHLEREREVMKDVREIREGKQETIPLEEVMAEYGL